MTITIGKQFDKSRVIIQLEDLLQVVLFPHLSPTQVAMVNQHFSWIRRQHGPMQVNCKLETVPELQATRIVFELSHQQLPNQLSS